ncbi:hypothetical protein C5F52_10310 [Limnohabitans sp. TS-CS-82]|jgi:hypothetical protein|nr:hypothetical protein C5F52_10310 [Limnohabitans sp. TS-CS-82]
MSEPIRLILIPSPRPDNEIIGLHGVANRLPSVDRLPGESLMQLLHRARGMLKGGTPILVYCRHAGEVTHGNH